MGDREGIEGDGEGRRRIAKQERKILVWIGSYGICGRLQTLNCLVCDWEVGFNFEFVLSLVYCKIC